MPTENWGEISGIPLQPPPFTILEDEREYLIDTSRFVLWTRKVEGDKE
jgi:hypothetical protein